jgi:hypothetical protein
MPVEGTSITTYSQVGVNGFELTHTGTTINVAAGNIYMDNNKVSIGATTKSSAND